MDRMGSVFLLTGTVGPQVDSVRCTNRNLFFFAINSPPFPRQETNFLHGQKFQNSMNGSLNYLKSSSVIIFLSFGQQKKVCVFSKPKPRRFSFTSLEFVSPPKRHFSPTVTWTSTIFFPGHHLICTICGQGRWHADMVFDIGSMYGSFTYMYSWYGKCTCIYHTLILWDWEFYRHVFLQTPEVMSQDYIIFEP